MTEEKPLKEYNPQDIEKTIRDGNLNYTPDILAGWATRLAGEWAWLASQMEEVKTKKPDIWHEIRSRAGVKSDVQTERIWEATQMGQSEIHYKYQMKRYEKLISTLRQLAEMKSREWSLPE